MPEERDPLQYSAALERFRDETLGPALRGIPGRTLETVSIQSDRCGSGGVVELGIDAPAHLQQLADATAETMSHYRSPRVRLCAGVTTQLLAGPDGR